MIDFGRVANNIITLLVVGGFGYMIYYAMKNRDSDKKFSFGGLFGKGGSGLNGGGNQYVK